MDEWVTIFIEYFHNPEQWVSKAFEYIGDPQVPWILSGGILLYAIFIWIAFKIKIWPIKRTLKKTGSFIAKYSDQSTFSNVYEDINQELLKNKIVSHVWSEFTETLIFPTEENKPIRNTHLPSEFFNEQNLIEPYVNLRFYQAQPNLLVGIGLLFTFIGLIAALYFASKGVSAPDVVKAQNALTQLLHAATFKFMTSVAGLFSSLLYSFFEKGELHKLQRSIVNICTQLDKCLDYLTPEKVSVIQLEESKKQTELLERFQTDLAVSIANNLEPILNNTNQNLLNAINKLGEKFGEMNQEGLDNLLTSFTDKLQSGAGTEMKALGDTLSVLVESVNNSTEKWGAQADDMLKRIESGIENLNANLAESSKSFTSVVNHTANEFSTKINSSGSVLGDQVTKFKESIDRIDQIIKHSEEAGRSFAVNLISASETFDNARDSFQNAASNIQSVSLPITQATNNLSNSIENFQEQMNTFNVTIKNLEELSSNLKATSAGLVAAWHSHQERFENVDEHVGRMFEHINTGLQSYTNRIDDFIVKLDKVFSNALTTLTAAVTELGEQIDEFQNIFPDKT